MVWSNDLNGIVRVCVRLCWVEVRRRRPGSTEPGAGDPLRLRVQLVDEAQQLAVGLVLVCVDDDTVKQVAAALLHLTGFLYDDAQLLGLPGNTI